MNKKWTLFNDSICTSAVGCAATDLSHIVLHCYRFILLAEDIKNTFRTGLRAEPARGVNQGGALKCRWNKSEILC
jgi:hypothetical protein